MATREADLTLAQVAEAVRARLADHPLNGVRLDVLDDQIWRTNGWWRVPVRPARAQARTAPFYEVLAETEEDLDSLDGLDILLVPVLPDEPEP